MKFNADHSFHIGAQHLRGGMPCQDYALSLTYDNFAYGIVSDGCSSGGKTDVGARLLAISAGNACSDLEIRDYPLALGRFAMDRAVEAQQALGLDNGDMLATLGYVAIDSIQGVAKLHGDGLIAMSLRDGGLRLWRFEWADNTPAYLAYGADLYRRFIDYHGGNEWATRAYVDEYRIHSDGQVDERRLPIQLRDGIAGFAVHMTKADIERADYVAVFTDGAAQVDGIEWTEVVRALLDFKSTAGDFAKRRLNRFLKEAADGGRGPLDDIAYAVVHIDHEAA